MKNKTLFLYTVVLTFIMASCYSMSPTIAEIVIIDELGNPVSGVEVKLYNYGDMQDRASFDIVRFTNGSGVVSVDFSKFYQAGQSGFAVLNVKASKNGLTSEGIINISEQEVTRETYIID